MATCNNNEERSHEFESEQGGVYGGVWREERKGRNAATTLISKQSRGNYEKVTSDDKPRCPSCVLFKHLDDFVCGITVLCRLFIKNFDFSFS